MVDAQPTLEPNEIETTPVIPRLPKILDPSIMPIILYVATSAVMSFGSFYAYT